MPPSTTNCPFCKTPLRTAAPIPPGKSVKCPRCAKVFAIPASAAQGAAGPHVQAAGWSPAATAPRKQSPSATGNVRKPGQVVPTARAAVRPVHPSAQGIRKSRGGSGLLIATLLGLFVLLLGGGGAAAYFLLLKPRAESDGQAAATAPADTGGVPTTPDSTKPLTSAPATNTAPPTTAVKPPPPPPPPPPPMGVQPIAFVPADSSIIVGVSFGSLIEQPTIAMLMEPLLKADLPFNTVIKGTGLETKDLFDQLVLAVKMPPGAEKLEPENATLVIKSSKPFNRNKVLDVLAEGAAKKAKDKEYYATKLPPFTSVYTPTDKMIVLSNLPSDRFEALVAGDGMKPLLPADALSLVRKVEKSQVWVVAPIDEAQRKQAQEALEAVAEMVPPEAKPLLAAVPKIRGLALWGGVDAKELRLSLGVDCTDAKTAKEVTATLQGLFDKYPKAMAKEKEFEERLKALPDYAKDLAKDLLDNTKPAQQDTLAEVSIRLRAEPLDMLAKEIKEKGQDAVIGMLLKPPAGEPPPGKEGEFAEAEKDLLTLLNEARDREKFPVFKSDVKLVKAARAHSVNMAKQMKLAHELDGKNFDARAKDAGYDYQIVNEYCLKGNGKIVGKQVYETVINNDEARKLVLDKQFEEMGIAFARNTKDEVYITIMFASPLK